MEGRKRLLRRAVESRRGVAFLQGLRDISGPSIGTLALGLVTGVAMAKSGVALPVILCLSLLAFASSSQLACLPLIATGAPLWVIATTAVVLNLRFVIFSAGWRRYFACRPRLQRMALTYLAGDPVYARFVQENPNPDRHGAAGSIQIAYFLGLALTNWAIWQGSSLAGLVLADSIPQEWGLGFIGILALLVLALPMISDRATRCSALASGVVALAAHSFPFGLHVLAAIVAAMITGGAVERYFKRVPAP